jgi:NADH-quinone oxidoreductase subunit J
MNIAFYLSALVTIIATIMVITRYNPVHALLYLVISLLSLSIVFALLGSPFAALLEIIVYAGAIMVLFIFVVMLLNLGKETAKQEKEWLKPKVWIGPSILSLILLGELIYLIMTSDGSTYMVQTISSKVLAISLFKSYIIGVQLAAMLLMAGVVAAAHIGQHKKTELHRFLKEKDPS